MQQEMDHSKANKMALGSSRIIKKMRPSLEATRSGRESALRSSLEDSKELGKQQPVSRIEISNLSILAKKESQQSSTPTVEKSRNIFSTTMSATLGTGSLFKDSARIVNAKEPGSINEKLYADAKDRTVKLQMTQKKHSVYDAKTAKEPCLKSTKILNERLRKDFALALEGRQCSKSNRVTFTEDEAFQLMHELGMYDAPLDRATAQDFKIHQQVCKALREEELNRGNNELAQGFVVLSTHNLELAMQRFDCLRTSRRAKMEHQLRQAADRRKT